MDNLKSNPNSVITLLAKIIKNPPDSKKKIIKYKNNPSKDETKYKISTQTFADIHHKPEWINEILNQIQEKKEIDGIEIFDIIYTISLKKYDGLPSDIKDNKDIDYLLNEFHYYMGLYCENKNDIVSFSIALSIPIIIIVLIKETYENKNISKTKNISYEDYLYSINFKYLVMFLWYDFQYKLNWTKSEHIPEWDLVNKKRNEINHQAYNIRRKYNFTSDIYDIKNMESMKIKLKQKLQKSKVNINDLEILLNSTQNNSKFPLYYNFYEFQAIKQILAEYKQSQTNNHSSKS